MSAHPTMLPGSSPVSSQRLFVILVLAVVALVVLPRESAAAPLVVGQDYYSVQLLSGTSAAVLQESLALVADQPYARIEKRGAEYMLRVGYWESRDEAVQAANALLPRFRGAHTRIAPYARCDCCRRRRATADSCSATPIDGGTGSGNGDARDHSAGSCAIASGA